ncbi:MAG: hypothetical protein ABSD74_07435 [Rhizomicrobium sp.]
MTRLSEERDAVAAATPTRRDLLGQACFILHFAVMLYVVVGWVAPWRPALVFYAFFLPAVATQWLLNKNSCVLNNLESLFRTGHWRDPGNEEEGAWLLTLARDTLGLRATQAQMDVFIYVVLALLWGLGLSHLLGGLWWHRGA